MTERERAADELIARARAKADDLGTSEYLTAPGTVRLLTALADALSVSEREKGELAAENGRVRVENGWLLDGDYESAWKERFDSAWADMRRIVAAGPERERDAFRVALSACIEALEELDDGLAHVIRHEGCNSCGFIWPCATVTARAALVSARLLVGETDG